MAHALKKIEKEKPKNRLGKYINRVYQGRKAYKLRDYRIKVKKKVAELKLVIKKCTQEGNKVERQRILKQVLALKNRLFKRENQ